MNNYIVPGFYATIEDYQLNTLDTVKTLKPDAIVYLGDLPDFVYLPDENSIDVNAVKRVRITPNTILPVNNVSELIKTLTGANILEGILTQEQKDELSCKDMLNVIRMSEAVANEGKLAIVKIVKRDGTRPDINNKFEVFQALENAYEKLGNVKCSQIVPIGIAGDEDFVTAEQKEAILTIKQSEEKGAVALDTIHNNIYKFIPAESLKDVKVELAFEHPEYLVHTASTTESDLIKNNGLDSDKVTHLLTGKVLVNSKPVKTGLQLAFKEDKFVLKEETDVEIIPGQVTLTFDANTVFATVKTTLSGSHKVAMLDSASQPLLNHYEIEKVKAEVEKVDANPKTCKTNEQVKITGNLKEATDKFSAKLEGADFTVTKQITLNDDGKTFEGIVTPTAEGKKTITFKVEEPYVAKTQNFEITVSGSGRKISSFKEDDSIAFMSVSHETKAGNNQYILITVDKPSSNWIEIKNKGNKKEVVDKIAILEGNKDGKELYSVSKSGTVEISFTKKQENLYKAIITDLSETIEPKEYEVKTAKSESNVTVNETTYLEYEGITFILYKGLLVDVEALVMSASVYFDAKADAIAKPVYVINYVPAKSEPIMSSLKFVSEQVKTFSEVLMVWGVRPPKSNDPAVVEKYSNDLVNLPKFKKGFKVRTSASKEVDYGMFLSVVAGTVRTNGIGGISNFVSHRVIDFEREEGGTGNVKPMTDKVFVELNSDFGPGSNVELKTYQGVKQKTLEAIVLSTKEVLGKTMLTLDKEVDTSVFSLDGFEVIISNIDSKDRHGSYAAAAFAIKANEERDRSPIQQEIDGVADFSFSQTALQTLLKNKFTVINKNYINGKATIVDTPLMTRKDSDYQSRSSIGTVLVMLNALRTIANEKKGKRFPKKEDKVMLDDELRGVFVNEMNRPDSLIVSFEFATDMSRLDSKGQLFVKFKVKDAKKLEVVEFTGGLAKL